MTRVKGERGKLAAAPLGLQELDILPHPEGSVLAVRAQPGARRYGIVGLHGGALKVAVTQPAEKGRANHALLKVLASALCLKRSSFALVSGTASPNKRILVRGLGPVELRRRLAALCEAGE